MSTSIRAKKIAFTFDCPDAGALAGFYAKLLGWRPEVSPEYPQWAEVLAPEGEEAGFEISCQSIPDYRAPQWPTGEVPQQAHLDIYVDSLVEAGELAVSLGATKHAVQPSETGSFVVYLDPVGHPFCFCQA